VKPHRRLPRKKPVAGPSLLERLNPNAGGIDCGADTHYVAVPPDRDATPVRAFKTFTTDLHRLADWLTACGVTTVAMESTGVYWIPLYEILEGRGFDVVLVNARHVKNVPGRKTDVVDCQWIQELHSVGLLRGSFRPTAAIAALRAYLRHRETLVQSAATHVQRMQKALVQMNLQLPIVISDITGVTGLRILRDIIGGQTDPHALAQHRDHRCQASAAEITAALTGHYRPEHVFVLQQNLALFDAVQGQLVAGHAAIEVHVLTLAAQAPAPSGPLPAPRTRKTPRAMSRGSRFAPRSTN
jgi:transposase